MRKIIFLIFFGTLISSVIIAQNWAVFNSSNSAIPFNSIKSLSIDSRGWLWLANQNSGDFPHVSWFDGSAWNSYLTTDKVNNVSSDTKGDVYFSTSAREILRYHFGAWFTQGSVLLSSAIINPIFCDHNNILWMGKTSSYYALLKYDGNSWFEYSSEKSGFPASSVECMQDVGENLWIGTKTHGLVKLTDTVFSIYNPDNSPLPVPKVSALAIKNDTLWIFCGNKLLAYKNNFSTTSQFPGEINVFDMVIDVKGNFWFTSNLGLIKFNRKSWIVYNSANSQMPEAILASLVVDKQNNIWIGTEANGLIRYNETKISAMQDNNVNLNLNCYPNPLDVKLNLTFFMPASGNVAIDLTDLQGKSIVSQNLGIINQGNNNQIINLPELSYGIYLLKVTTPFGTEILKLKK